MTIVMVFYKAEVVEDVLVWRYLKKDGSNWKQAFLTTMYIFMEPEGLFIHKFVAV